MTIRTLSKKSKRNQMASEDKARVEIDRTAGQRAERDLRKQITRVYDDSDHKFQPKFLGDETLSSKSPTHSQLLSIKKSAE